MATNRIKLSRTAWTSLGTGPMFLQNRSAKGIVYWTLSATDPGDSAPNDIADLPQNELGGAGVIADVQVNFAQQVWARGDGHVVVSN